jgi:hypothetical protein
MTNDNAGIFFYGLPPSARQIAALAEGAEVLVDKDGKKTLILINWSDVTLKIVIDPDWNRQAQLEGTRGWIGSFPEEERNNHVVLPFLSDLQKTTTCYGTVITPAYDHDGKVSRLLKNILSTSGGFFFSHQSFYDSDGKRIIGLTGDPSMLGGK